MARFTTTTQRAHTVNQTTPPSPLIFKNYSASPDRLRYAEIVEDMKEHIRVG